MNILEDHVRAFFCWLVDFPMQWTTRTVVQLAQLVLLLFHPTLSSPAGFPKTGNGLWYAQPGDVWSREWLPVGNGYLGGTFPRVIRERRLS